MSFVGGKLKLKGGEALNSAGGVKKKKKKKQDKAQDGQLVASSTTAEDGTSVQPVKTKDGFVLPPPKEDEDRRTEAQKRHEDKVAQLEKERLRKLAAKGYRERIKEFNEHLAQLTEHHDIQNVAG